MHGELVLVDRDILLSELRQIFDEKTSETLLSVLDKVAAQVKSGVTREDFSELKEIVARLATRMDELAARMDQLTTRMDQLTANVNELVEAQKRNETRFDKIDKRFDEIDKRLDQLSKQLGGLSESIGGDIEDIAYIVLHKVLTREFGWEVGVLKRTWLTWGEETEEINIFGKATDPSRPGKTIWIVGEAKHNLTSREVSRFVKQLSKASQNLEGEIFPVCFCYRARPEVRKQLRDLSIHLVFSYGEIILNNQKGKIMNEYI